MSLLVAEVDSMTNVTNASSEIPTVNSHQVQDKGDDDKNINFEAEYRKLGLVMPNPQKMRLKLNRLFASKEISQAEFLRRYRVNSNSLGRFMKLKGENNGYENGTYWAAVRYFLQVAKEEKLSGNKRKAEEAPAESDESAKKQAVESLVLVIPKPAATATASPTAAKAAVSVSKSSASKAALLEEHKQFKLDDSSTVGPVYDDCNDIRQKIFDFLYKTGISKAAFCDLVNVNSNTLSQFLSRKGPQEGAGLKVYYCAYQFFENIRIARNEPKSAQRTRNEKKEPNGFSLENPNKRVWVYMG